MTCQREAVYSFYENWRKELQIASLNTFLTRCHEIDSVVVLGHSMSAVDSEYMEQIEKSLNPDSWTVSYYDMGDIERVKSQGYSFQNKIRLTRMEDVLEK